jgi:transcriptional regulator with XRE-family HTH domain
MWHDRMRGMKGTKLRERRVALGLTQQGLAEKLQVTRNTVARWERDEMAIPGFLHLALKSIESEAAEGAANKGQAKGKR